ncbi:hypothetical protein LOC68_22675 [Blastopirellula sp. JC732]|uniref:DUF5673 domain-containing protein n=1 Tax=Blastopirellula sediminis TaxID=2894196 RepID=A0A9X1MSE0_9BACT|nr:hypothetical protein [Blastopirellula sediminis]MCC9605493.1 hypothetical protein [Blastopirellula sediminis]MCC9631207.1 hypothetical protein [Blastopirellula sediminis]
MIDLPNVEKRPQFQLRHVGVVVFVAAIALAIAAPWLRQWTATDWLILLRFVGCVAVGAIIYLLMYELRYQHIRRNAGRLLASVRTSGSKYGKIAYYFLGALLAASLFFFGLLQIESHEHLPQSDLFTWFLMQCLIPMQLSYQACFFLRRDSSTRLYENGLYFGGAQWFAWEQIDHWNWSSVAPDKLLIYAHQMQVAAIDVLPQQREEIESILGDRCGGSPSSTAENGKLPPDVKPIDAESH